MFFYYKCLSSGYKCVCQILWNSVIAFSKYWKTKMPWTDKRTDGRENSILPHKHSLRGVHKHSLWGWGGIFILLFNRIPEWTAIKVLFSILNFSCHGNKSKNIERGLLNKHFRKTVKICKYQIPTLYYQCHHHLSLEALSCHCLHLHQA